VYFNDKEDWEEVGCRVLANIFATDDLEQCLCCVLLATWYALGVHLDFGVLEPPLTKPVGRVRHVCISIFLPGTPILSIYPSICVCMYLFMPVDLFIHLSIYFYIIYIYIYMYVYICVFDTLIYLYTSIYIIYIYIYTYTCLRYTHPYIYIHTYVIWIYIYIYMSSTHWLYSSWASAILLWPDPMHLGE